MLILKNIIYILIKVWYNYKYNHSIYSILLKNKIEIIACN